MFHALMRRFQLELIYCFAFIFHRRPIQHLYVSTPTRRVENVVLTTKDLQERNIQMLDGKTVENKGKTID